MDHHNITFFIHPEITGSSGTCKQGHLIFHVCHVRHRSRQIAVAIGIVTEAVIGIVTAAALASPAALQQKIAAEDLPRRTSRRMGWKVASSLR